MAIARSVPLHTQRGPLQAVSGAPRRSLCPASARSRPLSFPRHRGQIMIFAASDKDGPEQPETPSPLIKAARQLAGATALAAVTLAAVVLRDRVTSPIIPPLLPRIEWLLPDAPSSTTPPATPAASARTLPTAVVNAGAAMHSDSPNSAAPSNFITSSAAASQQDDAATAAAPAKRPVAASVLRAVVRPVWGTATLPLRILDLMLFPDADLIRPLPDQSSAVPKQQDPASAAASSASDKLSTAAPAAAAGLTSNSNSSSLDAAATAVEAAPAAVLQSGAAAEVWALSVGHAVQDLLLQLHHFALAPASSTAAGQAGLQQLPSSTTSAPAAPPAAAAGGADTAGLPTAAGATADTAGLTTAAGAAADTAGLTTAAGATADTAGLTTAAGATADTAGLTTAARQAGSMPVPGLDVGSDAMSGETVAALRALLGSGEPLALPAVLAATGVAASVAALLVALASAASGKSKGSLLVDADGLQQLPLPCYTWPGYTHNMPDIAHDDRPRNSSSSTASAAASNSSSSGAGGALKASARAKPNAGDLLQQLPIICYSPPDVMHQLSEIACYQRQRSSSSSSNGQAADGTPAEPHLAAAASVDSTADAAFFPLPAAAMAAPPVPPASPAATADEESDDEQEWCLSSAAAYSLLGGPPKRPAGTHQQQQQQPGDAAPGSATEQQLQLKPARLVASSAGLGSILSSTSSSSSNTPAAAAAADVVDDESEWCLGRAAAYSLLGGPPKKPTGLQQQQQPKLPPADGQQQGAAAADAADADPAVFSASSSSSSDAGMADGAASFTQHLQAEKTLLQLRQLIDQMQHFEQHINQEPFQAASSAGSSSSSYKLYDMSAKAAPAAAVSKKRLKHLQDRRKEMQQRRKAQQQQEQQNSAAAAVHPEIWRMQQRFDHLQERQLRLIELLEAQRIQGVDPSIYAAGAPCLEKMIQQLLQEVSSAANDFSADLAALQQRISLPEQQPWDSQQQQQQLLLQVLQLHAELSSWVHSHLPIPAALGTDAEAKWQEESEAWRQQQQQFQQIEQQLKLKLQPMYADAEAKWQEESAAWRQQQQQQFKQSEQQRTPNMPMRADVAGLDGEGVVEEDVLQLVLSAVQAELRHKGVMLWQWRQRLQEHNPAFQLASADDDKLGDGSSSSSTAAAAGGEGGAEQQAGSSSSSADGNFGAAVVAGGVMRGAAAAAAAAADVAAAEAAVADAAAVGMAASTAVGMVGGAASTASTAAADAAAADAATAVGLSSWQEDEEQAVEDVEEAAKYVVTAQRMQQVMEQQQRVSEELCSLLQQDREENGWITAAVSENEAWELLQLAASQKRKISCNIFRLLDWLGQEGALDFFEAAAAEAQQLWTDGLTYPRRLPVGAAAETQWQQQWRSLQQQRQQLAKLTPRLQTAIIAGKDQWLLKLDGWGEVEEDGEAHAKYFGDKLDRARQAVEEKEGVLQQWGWRLTQHNPGFRAFAAAAAAEAAVQQAGSSSSARPSSNSVESGNTAAATVRQEATEQRPAVQRVRQLLQQQAQLQCDLDKLLCSAEEEEKDDDMPEIPDTPAVGEDQAWQLLQLAYGQKQQLEQQLQRLEAWLGSEQLACRLKQSIASAAALAADMDWWCYVNPGNHQPLGAAAEERWQQEWRSLQRQQQQLSRLKPQLETAAAAAATCFVWWAVMPQVHDSWHFDDDSADDEDDEADDENDEAESFASDVLCKARKAAANKEAELQRWGWRLQQHNPSFQPVVDAVAESDAEYTEQEGSSGSDSAVDTAAAAAAPAAVEAADSATHAAPTTTALQEADTEPVAAPAAVVPQEQQGLEQDDQQAARRVLAAQRMQQLLEQQQQLQGELSTLLQHEKRSNDCQPAAVGDEQAWQLMQLAISNKPQLAKQLKLLEDWLGEDALTHQLQTTLEAVQFLSKEAGYNSRRWCTFSSAVQSKEVGAAAEAQWQQEWRSLQQQRQQLARAKPRLQVALDAPELLFVKCGAMTVDQEGVCEVVDVELVLQKARKALDSKEGSLQQWGWQLQQHNAAFRPLDDGSAAAAAPQADSSRGGGSSSSGSSTAAAALAVTAAAAAAEQAGQQGSGKQAISDDAPAMQRVQQLLTQQQQLHAELTTLLQREVDAFRRSAESEAEDTEAPAVGEQQAWQLLQLAISQKQQLSQQLEQLEDWLGRQKLADHLSQQLEQLEDWLGRQKLADHQEALNEVQRLSMGKHQLWLEAFSFNDGFGCDTDQARHQEVGAAAEAKWVHDWRSLQQQRQQLARAEPLLESAVTAGTGTGGLWCVWRATFAQVECYDEGGHEWREVSIEEVLQQARKAVTNKEAALQRWGWRLQQHNPGFRPLDGDEADGSSSSSCSSGAAAEQLLDPVVAAAVAWVESDEDDCWSLQERQQWLDDDNKEWEDSEGAEQQAGSSSSSNSAAGAAAAGSAEQLLRFENGQAAEAAAAAAEAVAEAAAAQAGDAAACSGTAAAAADVAAVQADDDISRPYTVRFTTYRRRNKPQAGDSAAAATGASAGAGTDAAADAEAAYASAYQASFPAAFLEAFDATNEAGSGVDSDGGDELSRPFSSSSSSSSSTEVAGVVSTEDAAGAADTAAASSTLSSSSSVVGDVASGSSCSSSSSSAGSSSNSELLDELRITLGLQGATFTAQAYNAVAVTTASATGSNSSSSNGEVPHVVLLLCHALLQRGEESEAKLSAAVRCLAGSRHGRMLPVMLAGAMAGVFRPAEFNRPGSSAQLLLRVLSDALPPESYLALQQQLLMRGLLQEVEIPCTFEGDQQQQQQQASDSSHSSVAGSEFSSAVAAAAAASFNPNMSYADGLVDYGVYRQVQSNADHQQQQQRSKAKASTLSKFAVRKRRKQAFQQQQQELDLAAAAWFDRINPAAEQQQGLDFSSESWDEVGQYKPRYKWGSKHLNNNASSNGSGSSSAEVGWLTAEQQDECVERISEALYLTEGECAGMVAEAHVGVSRTDEEEEEEQEERWQRMMRAEQQWVKFAGLGEGGGAGQEEKEGGQQAKV